MNRDGPSPSMYWKPLIYSLKEHRKPPTKNMPWSGPYLGPLITALFRGSFLISLPSTPPPFPFLSYFYRLFICVYIFNFLPFNLPCMLFPFFPTDKIAILWGTNSFHCFTHCLNLSLSFLTSHIIYFLLALLIYLKDGCTRFIRRLRYLYTKLHDYNLNEHCWLPNIMKL